MDQTIQVLLEDKPGALMRAVGLVTAMGSNIHSLTVRPDPAVQGRSCLTLTAELTPRQLDLALRKLNSLIQVFDARELPGPDGPAAYPCHNCREISLPWTPPPA
ncbi:MAG TPA: hypothetical protein PKJ41_07860 [Bryobacteraceae bacterium]|nr:hypothetical protein [Bryobacteraceae bacterium]